MKWVVGKILSRKIKLLNMNKNECYIIEHGNTNTVYKVEKYHVENVLL